MAGYSGTPLIQKLGIKAGMRVHFCDAPKDFFRTLGRMPTVVMATRLKGPLDFIHYFTKDRAELDKKMDGFAGALESNGMLWVSWPKKAAKVETNMTEDVVRELAFPRGLVDVKVCAVDDVWSGLKLVRRLENR